MIMVSNFFFHGDSTCTLSSTVGTIYVQQKMIPVTKGVGTSEKQAFVMYCVFVATYFCARAEGNRGRSKGGGELGHFKLLAPKLSQDKPISISI